MRDAVLILTGVAARGQQGLPDSVTEQLRHCLPCLDGSRAQVGKQHRAWYCAPLWIDVRLVLVNVEAHTAKLLLAE